MTPELTMATWIDLAVKGAIVLGAAGLVNLLLRRAPAAARHLVWASAMAAVLILPLLTLVVPPVAVALPTLAEAPLTLAGPPDSMRAGVPVDDANHLRGVQPGPPSTSASTARMEDRAASPAATPAARRLDPWRIGAGLWLAGALTLLLRVLLSLVTVTRLVRQASPIDDETWRQRLAAAVRAIPVASAPRLLVSSGISVPMTCGIRRPAILLPAEAFDWSPERAQVVLLHELAHVRRRDCLVQVAAQVTRALHWFNPLTWLAVRRLGTERERACDDLVLASGTRGSDYATHLLAIARSARGLEPSAAAIAMARPSELEGRLLAILDASRPRGSVARSRLAWTLAGAATIAASLAALRLEARAMTMPLVVDPGAVSAAPQAAPPAAPSGSPTVPAPSGGVAGGVPAGDKATKPANGRMSPAAREDVARALAVALKDEDAEVREHAMLALARMRSPLAFEPIVAALSDASSEIRQHAADALGELGDVRAVQPLARTLTDKDVDVRQASVAALARLEAREAVPALLKALADESADVRQEAAAALGDLGGPSTAPALVGALKDPAAEVRQEAASALGQLGESSVVPALAAALTDADAEVREHVASALGRIGDAASVQALTRALKDASPAVRQQAAHALGRVLDRQDDEDADQEQEGQARVTPRTPTTERTPTTPEVPAVAAPPRTPSSAPVPAAKP